MSVLWNTCMYLLRSGFKPLFIVFHLDLYIDDWNFNCFWTTGTINSLQVYVCYTFIKAVESDAFLLILKHEYHGPTDSAFTELCWLLLQLFLAFDFCRFCVVIRGFSSPPQRPMTSDFEGFSIPDFIHYIYFPIFILEKEPVFPSSMLSA